MATDTALSDDDNDDDKKELGEEWEIKWWLH